MRNPTLSGDGAVLALLFSWDGGSIEVWRRSGLEALFEYRETLFAATGALWDEFVRGSPWRAPKLSRNGDRISKAREKDEGGSIASLHIRER